MFTGLVQHVGTVASIEPAPSGTRLVVDASAWTHRASVGESIGVSGVCLTVAEALPASHPAFDVVPESLARTTLGDLRPGDRVNLEAAATPMTLLGGHIVQGHIDGVATVRRVEREGEHRLRLRPPPELMPCLVPKGSVCVDGVSLTIASVDPADREGGWFEIVLIPTTLEKSTLGALEAGDRCNLETDCLTRAVVHYLRHFAGS